MEDINLPESFHYLLIANQSLVHKKILEELKDTELTIGQPKVLDYLRINDGVTQKEIAGFCHIEAGSLTVLLNRMEEKGMVIRKQKNGNRRSLYVYLTSYGKKLANRVDDGFLKIEQQAFTGISDTDIEIFMDVFSKIKRNLKRKEE